MILMAWDTALYMQSFMYWLLKPVINSKRCGMYTSFLAAKSPVLPDCCNELKVSNNERVCCVLVVGISTFLSLSPACQRTLFLCI